MKGTSESGTTAEFKYTGLNQDEMQEIYQGITTWIKDMKLVKIGVKLSSSCGTLDQVVIAKEPVPKILEVLPYIITDNGPSSD